MTTNSKALLCSVIVPVFEHWDRVERLLECLREQTLPSENFEILLVDNASTDYRPPRKIPSNARILRCAQPGSYAARNHGIVHALGGWLVFTDADCLPQQGWLQRILHEADRHRAQPTIVAGAVEMVHASERPNVWEIYDLVRGIPQDWYVARGYAATANLCVPKTLAREMGGFDTLRFSGGDAAFCRVALRRGASLHYCPEAIVEHPARNEWSALATKARRIKGGQLACQGQCRMRALLRTFLPPLVAFWRFTRSRRHPWRYRALASGMHLRVWIVEIVETIRLLRHGCPERR